jgi:DNA topoisomerase-1
MAQRRGPAGANLVFSTDADAGLTRDRQGDGFVYRRPGGRLVRDRGTLERIRSLAIPPAWEKVWICPDRSGHVQATGRDARGRKQYLYHPQWTKVRDADKYSRLIVFCKVLPRVRRRVAKDLRQEGLARERVIAAVVRLLETTLIRVGNAEYARENKSFGLTTLRDRHARVRGSTIRLSFRAKSGIEVEAEVTDRRVAGVVKKCQDLPGQHLFVYVDDAGEKRTITSQDVNDYLRETSGAEITAKDFRTWAGTVLAVRALKQLEGFESEAEAKRNVIQAVERVARRLGNTRAVARSSYVHPAVIDSYLDGSLEKALARQAIDSAVLELIQKRLKR